MKISLQKAMTPHTWSEISGRGTISTHDPDADALYGVNIAVDPDCYGCGIAKAIYEARFRLARELGCRAFVAGARIPGYFALANELTPEDYLEKVKTKQIFDPTLSKQIKLGFKVCGLLENYAPDPETLNYAALIQMEL
jgi:ribosomal protein S18 acetylase RimI-like enzyme